jgi:hypothetical protein
MLQDVLHMLVGEVLPALDDLVEVDFHVIGDKVDIAELLVFNFIIVEHIQEL